MLTFKKDLSEFTHPIGKLHKQTERGKTQKIPIYYTFKDHEKNMPVVKGDIHLTLLNEKNQVNQIAIYGSPGSGKSHTALSVMKKIRANDKKDWVLFSAKEEDHLFDDDWIKRYPIDKLEELEIEQFSEYGYNAIFDDYDSFMDKETNTYMSNLIRTILKRGRSLGINIICITQQGKNGKETKTLNDLFNTVILFPSSNKNSTIDFVKNKLGASKKQLEMIQNLPKSRFQKLIIRRNQPTFYYSDGIIGVWD